MKTYKKIAQTYSAYLSSIKSNSTEWIEKHEEAIEKLVKEKFPHGSGFDQGTKFSFEESTREKLVFITAYHHMNEAGFYDGWTEHKVIVTPSLGSDYYMKVTGKDRNQVKDYIGDRFYHALDEEIIQ